MQYSPTCSLELHGFCDASSLAYGAAVYARVINSNGTVTCTLSSTKNKVAPIKPLTIRRLKLNGAKMLTELMTTVREALNVPLEKCTFWCDSTVVLRWLSKELSSLEIFNANRVAYILEHSEPTQWRHVPTEFNPADLISRGKSASELIEASLWWHGPQWLVKNKNLWPQLGPALSPCEIDAAKKGEKPERIALIATNPVPFMANHRCDLIERFSNLQKIKKTAAIVIRFAYNFMNRCRPNRWQIKKTGPITIDECTHALHLFIKHDQSLFYSNEIKACETGVMPKQSPLLGLRPFIDTTGLLRVAGRINNSNLPDRTKFPIVVPKQSKVIYRLLHESHIETGHGGCDAMLLYLREDYHIVTLRKLVKSFIHNCVRCTKANAQTAQQQMGLLPMERITPGRPFEDTGMDYFGPFTLKLRPGRCKQFSKGYGIIFKCLRTRAVAIELVEDMTTASFLHAFARVSYTRGRIKRGWSDNGLYFLGAANELREIQKLWEAIQRSKEWQERGTEWTFIPPAAPHEGGVWERDIKTVKGHINRTIGNRTLTPEELRTLFVEISAYLNSRPLTPVYDNEIGVSVITPGHFLIGGPIIEPLTSEVKYKDVSHMKRWNLVQELAESLWQKWSKEYVLKLFDRNRWRTPIENVRENDIVLVKHETLARTKWPLAKVTKVFPGTDGLVRKVEVIMHGKRFLRPIQKLCILPVGNNVDLIEK